MRYWTLLNLDDKKVNEHIGFHYLLKEIQLDTLFLLEMNVPQEVLNEIRDKSIIHNIFRIQDKDFMCWFYCIAFIKYMEAEKTLLD